MRILADTNVPEEFVAALRGDGHDVVYSRDIDELGPEAPDDAILDYAVSDGYAILSCDLKDFGSLDAETAVFVAPHDMAGGEVRAAIARIDTLPFDPTETDPIWLSGI